MSEEKPMTMKKLQEKHDASVEKFKAEILRICIKPEYSNDVVRDGLDIVLNFVRRGIYDARRENLMR